jgi:hypothetical protein
VLSATFGVPVDPLVSSSLAMSLGRIASNARCTAGVSRTPIS